MPYAINNPMNPWYKSREMPDMDTESFKDWYKKNR